MGKGEFTSSTGANLSEVRVIGKYAVVVAVALTETCSCSTL